MTRRDLDLIVHGAGVLDAVQAAARLRRSVRGGDTTALRPLVDVVDGTDALGRALLTGVLAEARPGRADELLAALLDHEDPSTREHAAWRLDRRPVAAHALPGLLRLVGAGGFAAVTAALTVESWAARRPRLVADALLSALPLQHEDARGRLVELLGLTPDARVRAVLRDLVADGEESAPVRRAAAGGLGTVPGPADIGSLLVAAGDADPAVRLAAVAALAASSLPWVADLLDVQARAVANSADPHDRMLVATVAERRLPPPETGDGAPDGLRIMQVLLGGRLDARLRSPGAGDGGGLATLLVHLAEHLAALPAVAHVTTVTRSFGGPDVPAVHGLPFESMGPGASLRRIAFGPPGPLAGVDMWAHRIEIERALRRLFRRPGGVDVVHLRFADVGTYAALRVARSMRVPVVFTLAPDPHGPIEAAEAAGTLDRPRFGELDRREHLLFRAALVEGLADDADGLAVLPRAGGLGEVERLLGEPIRDGLRRVRTVAEGIDVRALDAAGAARGGPPGAAVHDLERALAALPAERRGLPVLLSVGRLHRVKGFDRLVEAWGGSATLHAEFNLVVVGGDLVAPSLEERTVLRSIEAVSGRLRLGAAGPVLLGHRPHDDVARILTVVRHGSTDVQRPGVVGACGLYACASAKEEFGLALLEALAAGLPVVAPRVGGPSTYVEDGRTGALVDTMSVTALRAGLLRTAATRLDGRRADEASATIRRTYTVDAMAAALTALYDGVVESGRTVHASA